MAIQQISASGYRPFEVEASLKTKALTLVFGVNSAGKSSLVRLIPLIGDGIRGKSREPFAVESLAFKGASGVAMLSKFSKAPVMDLAMSFEGDGGEIKISCRLRNFTRGNHSFLAVEEFRASLFEDNLSVLLDLDSVAEYPNANLRYEVEYNDSPIECVINFEGLKPVSVMAPAVVTSFLNAISNEFQGIEEYVWLGPLRVPSPRIEIDTGTPRRFDPTGLNASLWLTRDELAGGALLSSVSKWFEKTFKHSLQVVPGASQVGATYSLMFTPTAGSLQRVPVADTGEGMGQVIPVLTAAHLAGSGKFGLKPNVIIEHPDLHLHANVHKLLLDEIIECSKGIGNPRFIIESHSEAILIALQLAILENRISYNDVVVHWVDNDESGRSFARSIEFDADASPTGGNWPGADWFNTIHDQMRALARKKIMSQL